MSYFKVGITGETGTTVNSDVKKEQYVAMLRNDLPEGKFVWVRDLSTGNVSYMR